jgi:hypothetical protein
VTPLLGVTATGRSPRGAYFAQILERAVSELVPAGQVADVVEALRDLLAVARLAYPPSWVSPTVFAREALAAASNTSGRIAAALASLDPFGLFLMIACRLDERAALERLDGRYVAPLAGDLAPLGPPALVVAATERARNAALVEYAGRARLRTWLRTRAVREVRAIAADGWHQGQA